MTVAILISRRLSLSLESAIFPLAATGRRAQRQIRRGVSGSRRDALHDPDPRKKSDAVVWRARRRCVVARGTSREADRQGVLRRDPHQVLRGAAGMIEGVRLGWSAFVATLTPGFRLFQLKPELIRLVRSLYAWVQWLDRSVGQLIRSSVDPAHPGALPSILASDLGRSHRSPHLGPYLTSGAGHPT